MHTRPAFFDDSSLICGPTEKSGGAAAVPKVHEPKQLGGERAKNKEHPAQRRQSAEASSRAHFGARGDEEEQRDREYYRRIPEGAGATCLRSPSPPPTPLWGGATEEA